MFEKQIRSFQSRRLRLTASKLLSANTARSGVWSLFRLLLLIGLSFIIIYPILVKLSSSLMGSSDLLDQTVWFVPRHPTLNNIKLVLTFGKYWEALFNTFTISLLCAVLQTFVCAMVGYGFAKFNFRGKNIFFAIVVLTIIIPPQTIYISLYLTFRYFNFFGLLKLFGIAPLKLVENLAPITILSATALGLKNGLYIFVMRQFYRGVPRELNEAALVDGSNPIASFFRIMVPLSVPMMVSIFVLSFAWQWTDTFYADIFFRKTVVLPNIPNMVNQISSAGIYADSLMSGVMVNTAVLMIIFPILIFFLVAQRFLIQGIERSGIVG